MIKHLISCKDKICYFISKIQLLTILLFIGVFFLLIILLFGRKEVPDNTASTVKLETIQESQEIKASAREIASAQEQANKEIVVDIKGAVKQEGVYRLNKESRVTDLIKKAGGLTESADRRAVNLAQKLSDGSVVYIAKVGENRSVIPNEENGSDSSTIEKEKLDLKININVAKLEDLTKIPGIGEKRAKEIIDVRDSQGGFKKLEDLLKISGIGQKTLEKLKDDISID
ncbi:helix-hairpin-helix domain-containing protein [Streptococcus porcinus]|uniref:Helix-hairpin-helix domain-containing protein n=1 Tax=Streptococcus porcinus TaxID=1340 RepID=A0A7V9WRF0_STRPO|nr:helix-hairpin-helix domain-containing protein [Streptococcus porcinus]MBA2795717.1 helix-hairpin-helix domain-containing protein [Streptococcus porcinus]